MIGDNRVGLLTRLEELLGRKHLSDRLPIFVYVQDGIFDRVVRIVFLRVVVTHQRIRTDLHSIAKSELLLLLLVECRTRESNYDHYHAKVDDVPAISSSVAPGKSDSRRKQILPSMTRDHASSANELRNNGGGHQRRERNRHQRIEVCGVLPRTHTKTH